MTRRKDATAVDWLQEKLKIVRRKDKWGLPRDWRFWTDPFFWIIAVLYGPKYVVGIARLFTPYRHGIDPSLLWLLLGVALVCDAMGCWVAYDSYRWDVPNRPIYIILVLAIWLFGLACYILDRPQWLAELERRRHLPY